MKLYDKVYVKSQKTRGTIVDIIKDSYTVEKEGGYGPIYWNLSVDDIITAERLKEIDDFKDCLKRKNPFFCYNYFCLISFKSILKS